MYEKAVEKVEKTKDKIKNKNQPISHIFNNIKDEFPRSIQTFYNYVHKGYFSSINDEMLPRAYSYKPRKRTNENQLLDLIMLLDLVEL